ncbi:hypothetical protein SteCoe_12971 [Stentor coeruleus]|uniref:Transmembrane protein n=1 Tax=Stentor coeruleus TaxID=5963 RepID=A0A1R2C9M6_9CILI|nr:hypothetical protein SteCoe_12971 [Stentor coeruleus]
MQADYLKYQSFYNSHKELFTSEEREKYSYIKAKHAIAVLVGASTSPLFFRASENLIRQMPGVLATTSLFLIATGPLLTASLLMRKHYYFPFLKDIYEKYYFSDGEFDHLIDKENQNIID